MKKPPLFFLPGLLALCLLPSPDGVAQDNGLLARMAANEVAARDQHTRFAYLAEVRSTRTDGHLWTESVAETDDGVIRRLLAIDGRRLTRDEAAAESARIDKLVQHPETLRADEGAHRDDEVHATQLLQMLPRAFLISPAGEQDGCTRFSFRPNPAFQPSTYEERIGHAMGGTVSLKQPINRLCSLDGKLLSKVEFGYGFLGSVQQGGSFSLHRVPVDGKNWKSDRISVHFEGRILMLKSLAREQEVTRSNMRVLPPHLSLAQAAHLTLP